MGIYINDHPERIDLAAQLEEISPARRDYALGYRREIDRQLSVAVYLLLKEGLRSEYGLDGNPALAFGPGGKPYLSEHPEIHFNFSHCRKVAVCAISDSPVGVDVEEISPFDPAVAERVLSPDELKAVNGSPQPDVAFARFWTMKEALAKLRGEPLDKRALPSLLENVTDARLETVERSGYVLSLAK